MFCRFHLGRRTAPSPRAAHQREPMGLEHVSLISSRRAYLIGRTLTSLSPVRRIQVPLCPPSTQVGLGVSTSTRVIRKGCHVLAQLKNLSAKRKEGRKSNVNWMNVPTNR